MTGKIKDERIGYTIVSTSTELGDPPRGTVIDAFWTRLEAESASSAPYHEVVPIIIDMDAVVKEALATLKPVHKLVLGLGPRAAQKVPSSHLYDDGVCSDQVRSDDMHLMHRR